MKFPKILGKALIQAFQEGEQMAKEANKIAGMTVATTPLSAPPEDIRSAYYMTAAAEGGPIRDYSFTQEALTIAHNLTSQQLKEIAARRGIEL